MGLTFKIAKNNLTPAASVKLKRGVERALDEAAGEIQAMFQERVRVDTGQLKASSEVVKGDLIRTIVVGAAHGFFQEFGTEHQAPNPALTSAEMDEEEDFNRRVSRAVEEATK